MSQTFTTPFVFSVVVPCYNEEATLVQSVERLLGIADEHLSLEVLIVDDCSTDKSLQLAQELADRHNEIRILQHERNQGKGAALRTGFQHATGDYVGIHDADLEYNPQDLHNLLEPLLEGKADAVFGSRYLSGKARRVLYFYHTMVNKCLTFISNMFTDLMLTDMETCYKLFRRELIQSIDLREDRFGIEPEMVSKVAQTGARIYEIGISYEGRTYDEGKKIGWKDGIRALYCLMRYNAYCAPMPIQFLIYLFIGGSAAVFNAACFLLLLLAMPSALAAFIAFIAAAYLNYELCIRLLFRSRVRWNAASEHFWYWISVGSIGLLDASATSWLMSLDFTPLSAKLWATAGSLILNFATRKYLVFYEKTKQPF